MTHTGLAFWIIIRRGVYADEIRYLGCKNGTFYWNTTDIFYTVIEDTALYLAKEYDGDVEKITVTDNGVRVHESLQ